MGGHSAMTTSNFHKWNEVDTCQDHVLWLQSLLMEGKTYKEAMDFANGGRTSCHYPLILLHRPNEEENDPEY